MLYLPITHYDSKYLTLTDRVDRDIALIIGCVLLICCAMFGMIFYFSYRISDNISEPLRRLIEFSSMVNQSSANKTLINTYFRDLADVMNNNFVIISFGFVWD